MRISAIVTDIEGTTTPIAFVRDTLFPYARERLRGYLRSHETDAEVQAICADIAVIAPGRPPEACLLEWMDADEKITPLKALQGLIWTDGYLNGDLKGMLYPDVAPALRRWHSLGIRLYVYSSGSEAAQRLLFTHSVDGNLADLVSDFFDTRIGPKNVASSYHAIRARIGTTPADILFLSDMEKELDEAASAGLRTCQLVREEDGTLPSPRHRRAGSFTDMIGISGCMKTEEIETVGTP
jgi:enolase-phosphatase E1